jgi:ribosome-associated toxin RatA of RatAB toxin-antitoxin module
MALVEKSVLVGYSAQQMYALVNDIESYPQFLPWCSATQVEHRAAAVTRAAISVDYRGFKQTFRTENHTRPGELIEIRLVSGPFRKLDGTWRFTGLSPAACRIDFRLHYEFSTKLLELPAGPVFGYIANSLVDAFVKRADRQYAAR